jgi:hypothetical protein
MSENICSSCGNAVVATARFCTHCGTSLAWTPPSAVNPPPADPYAASTQRLTPQQTEPYRPPAPPYSPPLYQPHQYMPQAYGAAPARSYATRKDRTAAVIFAVFFGCWTWVYTYKRDAWKFWLSVALSLTLFNPLWTWLLLFLPNFGLHFWAIIDVAIKPQSFYDNYPHG